VKGNIMATQLLMTCSASSAACRSRRARRAQPSLGARLATLAIALVALGVMTYGERWMLEQSSAAASELTVATCMLDVVYGDEGPANACASAGQNNDKEKAL